MHHLSPAQTDRTAMHRIAGAARGWGKAAAISALIAFASGCTFAPPEDAYSVQEVLADISSEESELHGETVDIHGWLGPCGGLDCGIYASQADARAMENWQELPDDELMAIMDRRLAVGGAEGFDFEAGFMEFKEVVIRGEVNAAYHRPPDDSGSQFGCLDRCDDIRPHKITRIY